MTLACTVIIIVVMVLGSFVSEVVTRMFVSSGDSTNSGDQNITAMGGWVPERRIPSAVSRSVACAFGLLLLGMKCNYNNVLVV